MAARKLWLELSQPCGQCQPAAGRCGEFKEKPAQLDGTMPALCLLTKGAFGKKASYDIIVQLLGVFLGSQVWVVRTPSQPRSSEAGHHSDLWLCSSLRQPGALQQVWETRHWRAPVWQGRLYLLRGVLMGTSGCKMGNGLGVKNGSPPPCSEGCSHVLQRSQGPQRFPWEWRLLTSQGLSFLEQSG